MELRDLNRACSDVGLFRSKPLVPSVSRSGCRVAGKLTVYRSIFYIYRRSPPCIKGGLLGSLTRAKGPGSPDWNCPIDPSLVPIVVAMVDDRPVDHPDPSVSNVSPNDGRNYRIPMVCRGMLAVTRDGFNGGIRNVCERHVKSGE